MTINGVGPVAVSPAESAGTTYDAATGLVTTKTPITPGPHKVFLSILDQGDQIYDSAAFVDNLRFITGERFHLPAAVRGTDRDAAARAGR